MSAKRIGIFDYHLDNFHADVYVDALRGPLANRGYQVAGATAYLAKPSRAWCERKGLPYFDSLEKLARHSDYLMILAPSNPEKHLEMCELVFPLGKPTFVDKTFAPDFATAEKIFDCADQHAVPIQSTSALRSTNVQQTVNQLGSQLQSMIVYASGTSFEEYGIHPFELAISCLGPDVTAICRLGTADIRQYVLQLSKDRTAVINFSQVSEVPFGSTLITADGCHHVEVDTSRLFVDAAASVLDFFDAEGPLIDRRETLAIRRLLDLADGLEELGYFAELQPRSAGHESALSPHWHRRQTGQIASND